MKDIIDWVITLLCQWLLLCAFVRNMDATGYFIGNRNYRQIASRLLTWWK